jgi:intermediate cleaving peptidase 55
MLNYLTPSFQSKNEYDNIAEMLSGSRRRPLGPELFKLRAIKSEAEKHVMRRAADISAEGHVQVSLVQSSQLPLVDMMPGYEIHSTGKIRSRDSCTLRIHLYFDGLSATRLCTRGCLWVSFINILLSSDSPISRPNALMIHYIANNHIVNPGELILLDAGCEYK